MAPLVTMASLSITSGEQDQDFSEGTAPSPRKAILKHFAIIPHFAQNK